MHEEERKERDHSEILIFHERWVSFVSRNSHNITDNLTFIIIYNIVQHHLSDLTSLFPTSFQVTHAKIVTIDFLFEVKASARLLILWLIFRVAAFLHVSNSWILTFRYCHNKIHDYVFSATIEYIKRLQSFLIFFSKYLHSRAQMTITYEVSYCLDHFESVIMMTEYFVNLDSFWMTCNKRVMT